MKAFVYILVVVLLIGHNDYWNWHRAEPLVFGFIPVGLAYHASISLAAGLVWFMATRFCWPPEVDETEKAVSSTGKPGAGH